MVLVNFFLKKKSDGIKNRSYVLSILGNIYSNLLFTNQSIFLSLLLFFTCFGTLFLCTRPFDELVELVDELLEDGLIFFEELTIV